MLPVVEAESNQPFEGARAAVSVCSAGTVTGTTGTIGRFQVVENSPATEQ